eukprot:gnl/Spiro4/15073_TR8125_c0_g1_i1.p2 gnl/Spiro4/15073_TR8125_c0_g1~~gnl/Spiro4/15073_TR8125_c0_g1_i1.p2  ORF type:complete len:134 (-),score=33.16 gnl/Spiro4/15073_TR8125_c0_g1_i1:101-502(-)
MAGRDTGPWRAFVIQEMPSVAHKRFRDWLQFYRLLRAVPASARLQNTEPHAIEDCANEWEFRCPLIWESLKTTREFNKRHCDACNKTVTLCTSQSELDVVTKAGGCVAYAVDRSGRITRPEERRRMMGKRVAR